MEDALRRREAGLLLGGAGQQWGVTHRPLTFHRAASAAAAPRLQLAAQLPTAGAQFAVGWDADASHLLAAGEDCRLRIWRGDGSDLLYTLDTGHTSSILAAHFLPHTRDQVICGSADKQIRHINLSRGGARPYVLHRGRVRALVPLDSHVVLSGSEDGTVREVDVRQKPPPPTRTQELQPASEDYNVLVDQRAERIGRSRTKVGIYSLAVDQHRPWLILTGGTDPLLRLYDRRMLPPPADGHGSRAKAPQWVSCYIPSHLKADLWDSRPVAAPLAASPGYQLTAVGFARGGAEVVGSYSGHCIYAFDAVDHARDVESLLHIPETVLRVPTRPRSQLRRSVHQWTLLQEGAPPGRPRPAQPAYQGLSQAGSMQQAAAGGAGTPPEQRGEAGGAAAAGLSQQQLLQQGTGRAGPRVARHRTIGVSASLRHLEHLRREHSQVRSLVGGGGGEHAESSRPGARRQQRPSSSTLRSPLPGAGAGGGARGAGAAGGGEDQDGSLLLRHHQQQQHPAEPGGLGRLPESGSEMSGEASLPGPGPGPGPGPAEGGRVRRSRRLWQRRRGLAAGGGGLLLAEEPAAEEAAALEVDSHGGEAAAVVAEAGPAPPQPAVSGVAELSGASESDVGEEVTPMAAMPSPLRRRVSQRLAAAAAAAAAAAGEQPPTGGAYLGAAASGDEPHASAAAEAQRLEDGAGPGRGGATGAAMGPVDNFQQPWGRLPPRQSRYGRQQGGGAGGAAAAALDGGWVDSTVGVMQHHATQPDSSEVAAVSPKAGHLGGGAAQQQGGQPGGAQRPHPGHVQQAEPARPELTVEMQPPTLQGSGGGAAGQGPSQAAAVEVTSRPVLSASAIGAAATARRTGGHEVSSLDSAGEAAMERVDSVVQRPPLDAPSVGNAPRAATTLGTTAQRREGPEASTGHMGPPGGRQPPQWGPQPAAVPQQQGVAAAQQQQQHAGAAAQLAQRHWQHGAAAGGRHSVVPTASTGTSRPPSLEAAAAAAAAAAAGAGAPPGSSPGGGRAALRPRRHPALDHGSAAAPPEGVSHGEPAAASGARGQVRGGSAAAAGASAAAAPHAGASPFGAPLPHTHNLRRQHPQQQPGAAAHAALAGAEGQAGPAAPQQGQQAATASLAQPQATMLSGRGPSTVGNFLPPSQQAPQQSDGEVHLEAVGSGEDGGVQQPPTAAGQAAAGAPGAAAAAAQQAQQGPPDSAVGAILHVADTGGEEVMEPTMYRCCYWGHLNLMAAADGNGVTPTPNFALLGRGEEYLVAPSDDGTLFLWDYASGGLVGVLDSGREEGLAVVAPHLHTLGLASGGAAPVVQLWSPEAEEAASLSLALEAVERNAQALVQADLQPPAQPPPGAALLGRGGTVQAFRGPDGRQVRCNVM